MLVASPMGQKWVIYGVRSAHNRATWPVWGGILMMWCMKRMVIITHITSRLVYWKPEKRCDIVISCLAAFHVSPIWGYRSHLHPRRLWYGIQTGSPHNLVWRLSAFWSCSLLLSPSSQHIIRWWTHFTLQCETMIVACVQSFSSSGHTYRSHGFTRLASLITPAGKTPFPFSLYNRIWGLVKLTNLS